MHKHIAESLRLGAEVRLAVIKTSIQKIVHTAELITTCLQRGGKLMLFGNGGSAADAQHLAAEFVGRFARDRAPIPALALTTDTSALTAIANDFGFEQVFARQVIALGCPGDVVLAISTSGKSPNVLYGVQAARERGITTIGLTGGDGGQLANLADYVIVVPSRTTAHIQETHIAIGHALCEAIEQALVEAPPLCKHHQDT
jgi:D-sedoheptulose 7-phosphate isomerase